MAEANNSVVPPPARRSGGQSAFGGPRPASIAEFNHVELSPKQRPVHGKPKL